MTGINFHRCAKESIPWIVLCKKLAPRKQPTPDIANEEGPRSRGTSDKPCSLSHRHHGRRKKRAGSASPRIKLSHRNNGKLSGHTRRRRLRTIPRLYPSKRDDKHGNMRGRVTRSISACQSFTRCSLYSGTRIFRVQDWILHLFNFNWIFFLQRVSVHVIIARE